MEVLTRAIRQGKEIKGIQTRKQEFSQFLNDMTLYIEIQTTIKNRLELLNEFTVFQDTRPACKNQFYFYMQVIEDVHKDNLSALRCGSFNSRFIVLT